MSPDHPKESKLEPRERLVQALVDSEVNKAALIVNHIQKKYDPRIDGLQKDVEDLKILKGQISDLKRDSEDKNELLKKEVAEVEALKKQVEDLKKDLLVIFGIFASMVTFLSVEIQIFKSITNFWLLLGLTSFILAAVLLFAVTLSNLAKGKNEWKDFRSPVYVIFYLLLFVSVFFFWMHARDSSSTLYQTVQQSIIFSPN